MNLIVALTPALILVLIFFMGFVSCVAVVKNSYAALEKRVRFF